jgi:serpin B
LIALHSKGLSALVKGLDANELDELFKSLSHRKVNITMPRFKGESTWNLNKSLKEMGMEKAFSRSTADFGGIDGGADRLNIGSVIQKATIKIEEKGFEAAAATAVVMGLGSAAPKVQETINFVVDHPFLYLIRDPLSNIVLFLGTVSQPEE